MSQCVSGYKCLTFSQVVRLHKEWGTLTTTDTSTTSASTKVGQWWLVAIFMAGKLARIKVQCCLLFMHRLQKEKVARKEGL